MADPELPGMTASGAGRRDQEEALYATEIGGVPAPREAGSAFTFVFNMTGQPAASVPCGFTKAGLPIGLQIVGGVRSRAPVGAPPPAPARLVKAEPMRFATIATVGGLLRRPAPALSPS